MSIIREGMPYDELLNEARVWERRYNARRKADNANYQTSKDQHIGAALEAINLRLDRIEDAIDQRRPTPGRELV